MSKGMKILVLVLLLFLSTSAFGFFEKNGPAQATLFFSITTVGLLVAVIYVALARGESRRR